MMLAQWWAWIVAGVVLAVLEVMIPGFVFLGFAIGAALTGLLMALILPGDNLALTVLVFAVLSLAAWLALRRLLAGGARQVKIWTRDINDN